MPALGRTADHGALDFSSWAEVEHRFPIEFNRFQYWTHIDHRYLNISNRYLNQWFLKNYWTMTAHGFQWFLRRLAPSGYLLPEQFKQTMGSTAAAGIGLQKTRSLHGDEFPWIVWDCLSRDVHMFLSRFCWCFFASSDFSIVHHWYTAMIHTSHIQSCLDWISVHHWRYPLVMTNSSPL